MTPGFTPLGLDSCGDIGEKWIVLESRSRAPEREVGAECWGDGAGVSQGLVIPASVGPVTLHHLTWGGGGGGFRDVVLGEPENTSASLWDFFKFKSVIQV